MLTFIIYMLVLSIVICTHELGHFIMARRNGVKVEIFSFGFGPKLFSKKGRMTEYIVCAIPFGGYVKMAGENLQECTGKPDEYYSQPPGRRFQIIVLGPLVNYILGFLLLWFIFCVGYSRLTTKVGSLRDGYGAKLAGIEVGDKIIALDGKKVEYWEDMQQIIQTKKSTMKVEVSFTRNNKTMTLAVPVKEETLEDPLGKKHNVGLIGITPYDETVIVRHGFVESAFLAFNKVWDFAAITYQTIGRIVTGKMSVKSIRDSVAGPLGMFDITRKVISLGFVAVVNFMAAISVSLAVVNLLPIPAFDGGHILLLFIEKIRGKSLSFKVEHFITQIGFSFIIMLALIITYNDILRLFGDKISKLIK